MSIDGNGGTSRDDRLRLAVAIAHEGGLTDPRGQPLFPAPAAAYRGAPIPLLAGNRTAHAQALADCRPDARPEASP